MATDVDHTPVASRVASSRAVPVDDPQGQEYDQDQDHVSGGSSDDESPMVLTADANGQESDTTGLMEGTVAASRQASGELFEPQSSVFQRDSDSERSGLYTQSASDSSAASSSYRGGESVQAGGDGGEAEQEAEGEEEGEGELLTLERFEKMLRLLELYQKQVGTHRHGTQCTCRSR